MQVGGYPRFKFGRPAPALLKTYSTRTRMLNLLNWPIHTDPAADRGGTRGLRVKFPALHELHFLIVWMSVTRSKFGHHYVYSRSLSNRWRVLYKSNHIHLLPFTFLSIVSLLLSLINSCIDSNGYIEIWPPSEVDPRRF